jgi:hypothetical protein
MELKFLTLLSTEQVDYKVLLQEKLGRKKLRWYHSFLFLRTLTELTKEVEVLRNLDPEKVKESTNCTITRPESVEMISYGAMIELQTLFQNGGDRGIGELITEQIAICCYESHTKKPFDSDTEDFAQFRKLVSEQEIVSMLGLHNWIHEKVEQCIEKWNNLFKEVRVYNQDWDNAGGEQMNKFNVLNTIRKICESFNVTYYQALQMPYGLTQATSLSDATQYAIQDRMRIAIEARM